MTTVSSLYVRIQGDASGLRRSLAESSLALRTFGSTASTTSSGASRALGGLGVAFVAVAAGAKAVGDFTRFQTTMVRTTTLAGATEDQMKKTSAEILDVAVSLGKGPQELADALYFTESAGIDAAKAMDVVTVAAKASAVGLGDTQTVADALTSVLNAYGEENISAAQAADILTAAVREGKGEADAIAGAIGRVIPIASQMGVTFDQVAGGIAALTQTGLDANEAVTALRGILTGLLNPTNAAADAMEAVGLSAESVRKSIAQQGLLPTLQDLEDRFHGNTAAMGVVFGNVRALAGAMSLLGSNSDDVAAVMERVSNSSGTVNEAFKAVQETAQFKLDQAMAAVEGALIKVGGALAPIVTAGADVVATIADIAGGAGFLLAPLKALADNADLVAKAFVAWFLAAKVLPGVLGLAAKATTAVSDSAIAAEVSMSTYRSSIPGVRAATTQATTATKGLSGAFGTAKKAATDLSGVLSLGLTVALIGIPELLDAASVSAKNLADTSGFSRDRVQKFFDAINNNGVPNDFLSSLAESFEIHPEGGIEALDGLADNMRDLLNASTPALEGLTKLSGSSSFAQDHIIRLASAMTDFSAGGQADFVAGLNESNAALGRISRELRNGEIPLSSFIEQAQTAGFTFDESMTLATRALNDGGKAVKDYTADTAQATTVQTAYGRTHAEVASVIDGARGSVDRMTAAQQAQADAAAQAAREQERWRSTMAEARPTLDTLGSLVGTTSQEMIDGLHEAADKGPAAVDAFIANTLAPLKDWRDEVAATIGDVSGVLGSLAGKSNLTAQDVHEAFVQAAKDAKAFGDDLSTIAETGGQAGKDLASALLQMGPSAAGLADVVAGSGTQMREQLVSDFGSILGAGQDSARDLQTALVGPLKDIRGLFLEIARHWEPSIDIHGATKAERDAKAIRDALNEAERDRFVNFTIHTTITGDGGKYIDPDLVRHHTGGRVGRYHDGGDVVEPPRYHGGDVVSEPPRYHGGMLAPDEVPAILQRGEFVIRRRVVDRLGAPFFDRLNRLHEGGTASGTGSYGPMPSIRPADLTPTLTAAMTAAMRAIMTGKTGDTGVERGLFALIQHTREIASLFAAMGTSVRAFARDARAALRPQHFHAFIAELHRAAHDNDWRAFADQIREAVGPDVWRHMADDARRAFESGRFGEVAETIRQAIRTDQWRDFAKTVRQDATQALREFHDAAVASLDFTSSALGDLESAATSAMDQLRSGTELTGGALWDLQDAAHLSGQEVAAALEKAARQTRAFGHDLLEISKIGGQAGKDLAASLLQSGNMVTAAAIADAPAAVQRRIVDAFGEATSAAETFATKLTNSIVGTLKDIEKLLRAIARRWDVKLNIDATRHHEGGAVMHGGGVVLPGPRFHDGGAAPTTITAAIGGLRPDEVPAILQRGEFVMRRSAVRAIGVEAMVAINRLHVGGPAWSGTGPVRVAEPAPAKATAGATRVVVERGPTNIRVMPDARRFGRALDADAFADGGWR